MASEVFQSALAEFIDYVNAEVLADSISYVESAEHAMDIEGHEISVSIIKK